MKMEKSLRTLVLLTILGLLVDALLLIYEWSILTKGLTQLTLLEVILGIVLIPVIAAIGFFSILLLILTLKAFRFRRRWR